MKSVKYRKQWGNDTAPTPKSPLSTNSSQCLDSPILSLLSFCWAVEFSYTKVCKLFVFKLTYVSLVYKYSFHFHSYHPDCSWPGSKCLLSWPQLQWCTFLPASRRGTGNSNHIGLQGWPPRIHKGPKIVMSVAQTVADYTTVQCQWAPNLAEILFCRSLHTHKCIAFYVKMLSTFILH